MKRSTIENRRHRGETQKSSESQFVVFCWSRCLLLFIRNIWPLAKSRNIFLPRIIMIAHAREHVLCTNFQNLYIAICTPPCRIKHPRLSLGSVLAFQPLCIKHLVLSFSLGYFSAHPCLLFSPCIQQLRVLCIE